MASNVAVTVTLSNGPFDSVSREGAVRFIGEGEHANVTVQYSHDDLPDVATGDVPQMTVDIDERGQLHDSATFDLSAGE